MKNGTKYRVVWGNVCRGHGTNGVVRAKFRTNLPVRLLEEKDVCFREVFRVLARRFPSCLVLVHVRHFPR